MRITGLSAALAAIAVGGGIYATRTGPSGAASALPSQEQTSNTAERAIAPPQTAAIVPLGSTVTAPTNANTVAPTTTWPDAVRLPVPALLPEDAYAETPDQVIGSIIIPKLGVEDFLRVGMTLTSLNRGPSHWPGTAAPGQLGNVVVGGHRTTFTHPFLELDKLTPGDRVIYRTPNGEFDYQVENVRVVEPSELTIADQSAQFTSTLFACHPAGSARYRIVASLRMVGPDGVPIVVPPMTVLNSADTVAFRS